MIKIKITVFLFFLLRVSFGQIPTGYYNSAEGKSGETLKNTLYLIIKDHTELSYSALWTAFQTTDDKTNGKVWDMYSDKPGQTPPYEFTFGSNQCGNYNGEADCYNREHSFPKSWFNDATPMYTDLFHLYPTDGYVNSKRSNYPFGEVNSPTWTSLNGSKVGNCSYPGYSGIVFEPIDAYKGDFARSYFYMVTRYHNIVSGWSTDMLNGTTYPAFSTWAKNMLLEWSKQDPVSQKEIDRNNDVYNLYQHNRNPFIDHPEYAELIWSDGITPVQFTSSPITTVEAGTAYQYNINVTGESGTTIAISCTSKPSWLTFINISNGVARLSGTPTAANIGDHSVVLSANDGFTSAQQNFTIAVSDPQQPNTLPVINNITFNPANPYTGEPIYISASITDSDGTIQNATVNWGRTAGNFTNNVSMSYSNNIYQGVIVAQSQAGTIYYQIEAKDNLNGTSTSTGSFTITENQTPIISNIVINPSNPFIGQTIDVSASIIDSDGTIQSAVLNWGRSTGSLSNQATMTFINNAYLTSIAAQNQVGTIYFQIVALDNLNGSSSSTGNFTIQENLPPAIDNIAITPENPIIGDDIIVMAEISDPENELNQTYILWGETQETISNEVQMTLQDGKYIGYINGFDEEKTIYITVEAIDNIGQKTSSSIYSVTIVSPNQPPVIQNIQFSPLNPASNNDVAVSATITDDDGTIANAILKWGLTETNLVNEQSMVNTNSGYTATIPHQVAESDVYFRLKATDNLGSFTETSIYNYKVSPATGISIDDNSYLKIYPNPADDRLTVEMNNSKDFQVELVNLIGSIVLKESFTGYKITLDLANIKSGVYLIIIKCDRGSLVRRVIKK